MRTRLWQQLIGALNRLDLNRGDTADDLERLAAVFRIIAWTAGVIGLFLFAVRREPGIMGLLIGGMFAASAATLWRAAERVAFAEKSSWQL